MKIFKINRTQKRIIGGVCEGIALRYSLEPILVRAGFILASLLVYFPFLIYLLLWLVLPNYKEVENKPKKRMYQILGLFLGVQSLSAERAGLIALIPKRGASYKTCR